MKFRVIPTVLTNGNTVVKGENFNNWRTVGSAEAIARLYSSRNVDELLFLDVNARKRGESISSELIQVFSELLDIPFAVGGGIDTYEDAARCFRSGAEKVVLGTSAIQNPPLISEIANGFGAQAVVVSLDLKGDNNPNLWTHSGEQESDVEIMKLVPKLEALGAGEILLQNIAKDGLMQGMDLSGLRQIAAITQLPIIASSGCGNATDALLALDAGASSVAAGAMFLFTEVTPLEVREHLRTQGKSVRNL